MTAYTALAQHRAVKMNISKDTQKVHSVMQYGTDTDYGRVGRLIVQYIWKYTIVKTKPKKYK